MKNKINQALENYGKLMNIDKLVQSEEDILNICILTAKIQDLLANKQVDHIVSKVDKDGEISEKYLNIKKINTDVLSNNIFYIELECTDFKYHQFHLSSLDKINDDEIEIFWYNKNKEGNYVVFDKKYLSLDFDIKFMVNNKIVKSNSVELYLNYMDWERVK